MVLGYARSWLAYEADDTRFQIIQSAKIIENFSAVGIGVQRIDGKIAPRGVFLPIG